MTVLQNLTENTARQRSALRTSEIITMFEKIMADSITVTTQSTTARSLSSVEVITRRLRGAYQKQKNFYADIQKQVLINLEIKMKRIGADIIHHNLDRLSEYLILELGWFYAFFQPDNPPTEVHPGPELFTKRKLFRGEYLEETGLAALKTEPIFFDLNIVLK